ncbi:hypothetical protein [Streptomyces sp. C10-9-1]|uniref:hypothetical protein n=1 Tax=Streptomyces sp. C10-9-1 TaxID=1859285 RepID=UPI003F4A465B
MANDTYGQEIFLPALTDQPNIEVLASAVHAVLARSILRFASATERAATIPSPVEGMMAWLQDTNTLTEYNGSAWVTVLSGGAWSSYTPSWTAATTNPVLGNGTISGEYTRVGDTVTFAAYITAGSSTTFGSGGWSISLPVQSAATMDRIGDVMVGDATSPTLYSMGAAYIAASASHAALYVGGVQDGGRISATYPQTWADGDRIWVGGTYRAL